jgi:hypothetical protein
MNTSDYPAFNDALFAGGGAQTMNLDSAKFDKGRLRVSWTHIVTFVRFVLASALIPFKLTIKMYKDEPHVGVFVSAFSGEELSDQLPRALLFTIRVRTFPLVTC